MLDCTNTRYRETQLYSDVDEELLEKEEQAKKKKASWSVSTLLEEWLLQHQDKFMDEFMRLEGSPLLTCFPQCVSCATSMATFRCTDCFAESLFCQGCLLSFHCREPFHRVQHWTAHFTWVSLKELGAVFHLGHNYGSPCTLPSSPTPLTVFDVTGVHTINITYCECDPNSFGIPHVQLLRARWFPATWRWPSTAFTFRLLNFVHKLQSNCKVNLFDFHATITAMSDNAGLGKPLFRYNELSLVFRIYVYLRQLRRGGCANIVGGLSSLPDGALAVECPACPQPGRNIELTKAGLVTRPPMFETMYLSMDANFKLKQKERGFSDPPLANGYAYMVSNKQLLEHLAHCKESKVLKDEVAMLSPASEASIVLDTDSNGQPAWSTYRKGNGMPTWTLRCSLRFFLLSVQASNVFLSLMTLAASGRRIFRNVSVYAISSSFELLSLSYWRVVIPKFHLAGHGKDCQLQFNINFTKGAARMSGEMVESGWAQSGPMAIWSRENGPFARRAVLDDHWGAENWRKVRQLRFSLLKNLQKASGCLSVETLADWNKMQKDFDQNITKPNPYEEPEAFVTMTSLKKQLNEDDRWDSRQGRSPPHTVTASAFIMSALQIEERQRDLRLKEQEAIKANTVAGGLAENRKLLAKDIREFQVIQKVYMPGLSHLLDESDNDSRLDTRPELFKLRLPSQLSPHNSDDALAEIRRLRRLFQGLSDQSKKHIANTQHTVTRARGTFEWYKACISRFATLYRQARRVLITLDPTGEVTKWTSRLLELDDTDIRGPGREEDERSEGHLKPSWIWQVPKPSPPLNIPHANTNADINANANNSDEDLSCRATSGEEVAVSIRAHWARCQARAEHHEEEVQDARGISAAPPDPQIQHGLRAYTNRQALVYSSPVNTCVDHWRTFLTQHSLGLEWLNLYPAKPAPEFISSELVDGPLDVDGDDNEQDAEVPTDQAFEERMRDREKILRACGLGKKIWIASRGSMQGKGVNKRWEQELWRPVGVE
ncbi:hypothetical protein BJ322DRAFT_1016123 [Thelephora terrestris]|uniref:CxC2-like cysteine cluster KDZ transposase-associated domain-containing protein n=1 Tax=Thelephora terrestris TaxID=56493 RepID=A0A9P6LC22_9AGAM|nr:hypothetical protein BJ322DRAFT_1016123 [Thelephora terrestris]